MLSKQQFRLWLSILIFAATLLACEFTQKMGSLSPNGEPVQFVAKGETNHIWAASVRANVAYELTVSSQSDTNHTGARIQVCNQAGDLCPDEHVIASASSLQDGASLNFSVNQDQQVYFHVFVGLGEGGEEIGTFLIVLREVN